MRTSKPGRAPPTKRTKPVGPPSTARPTARRIYYAMKPLTGGTNTLYIGGYNPWAEVSAAQDAVAKVPGLQQKISAYTDKEGDFLNGVRVTWAAFQPDMTIGDVPDFAKVHGYRI